MRKGKVALLSGTAMRSLFLGLMSLFVPAALFGQTTYYCITESSQTKYWTNSATWSPAGVPGANDTVILTNVPWPYIFTLTIDQPWACSNLIVDSRDGNDENLNVNAEGTISSVTWSNTRPTFGWAFRHNLNPGRVTLTEWHDVGPLLARFVPLNQSMLEWAGPVKITYHTAAENRFTVGVGFTNASSVYLARSPY